MHKYSCTHYKHGNNDYNKVIVCVKKSVEFLRNIRGVGNGKIKNMRQGEFSQ